MEIFPERFAAVQDSVILAGIDVDDPDHKLQLRMLLPDKEQLRNFPELSLQKAVYSDALFNGQFTRKNVLQHE